MVNKYENALRSLITIILGGSDKTDFKLTKERVDNALNKREIELKKYKGVLVEDRIIYYTEFYDLGVIINKNWELFKPALHDKKEFETFFSKVEDFRNTLSHGRDLLSFQTALLEGILGTLKSQIVLFHNESMDKDDYFIKIMSAQDSLGNTSKDNSMVN